MAALVAHVRQLRKLAQPSPGAASAVSPPDCLTCDGAAVSNLVGGTELASSHGPALVELP